MKGGGDKFVPAAHILGMNKAALMRSIIIPLSAACVLSAAAQFPPPTGLVFTYEYNNTGMVQDCDGNELPLYANCSHFHWNAPDTAGIPSTLVSYTVHWDGMEVATVPDTFLHVIQGFMGSMWVTANYTPPDGSSEPSNVVFNMDLPISTGPERDGAGAGIRIWPSAFTDIITVRPEGTTPVRMALHDAQGRLVREQMIGGEIRMDLQELAKGTYMAFFWKGAERMHSVQLVKQ